MGLTSTIGVNISSSLTGTAGLAPVQAALSFLKSIALADGTDANEADVVYSQSATILTAGTLSLDLNGSLEDALGAAFTPAKLRAVLIYSRPTNTTNLTCLGDAASVPILNTAATTFTLAPGGLFLMVAPAAAGIAVTATTGDIVKIVNAAGASAVVDVVLIGTSA
jgi:hypothetical protein